MGIESLLQQNMQNAGLAGSDRLARNAMFPQAQMDKTQYAVPSQIPTSAETIRADYDAPTNAYTGLPDQPFAEGGDVEETPQEPAKPLTMAELADQVKTAYRTNQNYDQLWKQFAATKEQDPQAWYKHQLDFLGNQVGWQLGQNTGDRVKAIQPQIDNTIEEAKAAGLKEDEINKILNSSSQQANITNQNRIAQEAAQGKGWINQNIPGGYKTLGAIALAAAAPYALGALGTTGAAAAEGLTTADILGSTFTGSQFAIDPALAYTAAGAGAAEGLGGTAAAQGFGLKDAYNAYRYANMANKGLNMLSNIAGGNQGGSNAAYGNQGINNPYAMQTGFNPGVRPSGLGIDSAQAANPWANLTPNIMLSRLSEFAPEYSKDMAAGGIAQGVGHLGSYSDGGRLLKGPGDGMSDNIPATIADKQPARLADGEFVIPADVVSHLGNGSTDAGAKQLYKMMDRIRKARTGNPKQGKQINPDKFTPKG